MEKLGVIITLCFIVLTATPIAHSQDPHTIKNWYRNFPQMKQKVTELHFYLHDIVAGPNATNVPVVMPNSTLNSPTLFGLIAAIDDPLTAGPSLDSAIVGRARGIFSSTGLSEIGYHMTFNFVFTSGEYNGSTISLIGHNPFMHEFRELPIVGGSGVFRLAQGTALLDTMTFNSTTGDAVIEYHVIVLHY